MRPWKCVISKRDSAKQIPKEVQLFLLTSYFVLGNVYRNFNLLAVFCFFETFKMLYPQKGLCKADTEGGSIVFNYILFCVRKRTLDFQFTGGFCLFEIPRMFYPPEGGCGSSSQGVQLFLHMLYWCRKRILDFQFTGAFLLF